MSNTTSTIVDSRDERASTARAFESAACFYCGTPARGAAFHSGDKHFCCNGCLAVYELPRAIGGSLYIIGAFIMAYNLWRTAKSGVFVPDVEAQAAVIREQRAHELASSR